MRCNRFEQTCFNHPNNYSDFDWRLAALSFCSSQETVNLLQQIIRAQKISYIIRINSFCSYRSYIFQFFFSRAGSQGSIVLMNFWPGTPPLSEQCSLLPNVLISKTIKILYERSWTHRKPLFCITGIL